MGKAAQNEVYCIHVPLVNQPPKADTFILYMYMYTVHVADIAPNLKNFAGHT